MDWSDNHPAHLRRIAEHARQVVPRLVRVEPVETEGRTVVHIETDGASVTVYARIVAVMEDFGRREGIPPDYKVGMALAPIGVPVPRPKASELQPGWPAQGGGGTGHVTPS